MDKRVAEMTKELLIEFDEMVPEEIDALRKEWLEELGKKKEDFKGFERVVRYVNAVCDVAISRANRKMAVA